jgi:hypothetical protein
MTAPVPADPLVLVALDRPLLAELLDPSAAALRLRIVQQLDVGADALLLGLDVVPPRGAGRDTPGAGVEATIAAITLAHLTRRVGLIVAAAP